MMLVNWVFADTHQLDPVVEPERLKSIGPTWGSWRTWRSCNTDNVICHDLPKATDLIGRAFQAVCNFYVPKNYYQDLGRPMGVKLYDGEFAFEIDHVEDIVAMHLVSDISDIVLLVGFDLGSIPTVSDKVEETKLRHYHGMIRSKINNTPEVQWVLVDHPEKLDKIYQDLPNLTCDTMENALKLLL
jgi:hypothetical protein